MDKRPDGLALIPWLEGRCLVWDATMADITTASYMAATAAVAGNAVESAAVCKEAKYVELSNHYHFFPIAIELYGPLCNKATSHE